MRLTVDGRGDPVLVSGLQAVQDAQDLCGIAAGGGRVAEDEADGLLGVDDEDGADGESNALCVDVCRVEVINHAIEVGNLAFLVGNDGELEVAARDLVDVLDPLVVRVDGVSGQADQFCAAASKLGLELCKGAELCGADGGLVGRVREQNSPLVANELVEVNRSGSGFGLEVGGSAAKIEGLWTFSHCGVLRAWTLALLWGMAGYAWRGKELSYLELGRRLCWAIGIRS